VDTFINLQGGVSEIKIRQAIGRGTRLVEGKKDFTCIDFKIETPRFGGEPLSIITRHAETRAGIYDDVYGPVEWL
jgi:superfamily II DNA or RNA helicase